MNKRIRKKKGLSKIQKRECYTLKETVINFVLPRLKKFKEINVNLYPDKCGSIEKWHEIIDEMIWSFEFAKDVIESRYSHEYLNSENNWTKYNKGMDLFKEYLFDLWD